MTRAMPERGLGRPLRAAVTAALFLGLSGWAAAAGAPPPPTAAQIKDCIRQMDAGNRWRFEWKTLEIGEPRHPLNNLEGGAARRDGYGYPVHVVYSLAGLAEVDAVYWLMQDANGHWQIPAICSIP